MGRTSTTTTLYLIAAILAMIMAFLALSSSAEQIAPLTSDDLIRFENIFRDVVADGEDFRQIYFALSGLKSIGKLDENSASSKICPKISAKFTPNSQEENEIISFGYSLHSLLKCQQKFPSDLIAKIGGEKDLASIFNSVQSQLEISNPKDVLSYVLSLQDESKRLFKSDKSGLISKPNIMTTSHSLYIISSVLGQIVSSSSSRNVNNGEIVSQVKSAVLSAEDVNAFFSQAKTTTQDESVLMWFPQNRGLPSIKTTSLIISAISKLYSLFPSENVTITDKQTIQIASFLLSHKSTTIDTEDLFYLIQGVRSLAAPSSLPSPVFAVLLTPSISVYSPTHESLYKVRITDAVGEPVQNSNVVLRRVISLQEEKRQLYSETTNLAVCSQQPECDTFHFNMLKDASAAEPGFYSVELTINSPAKSSKGFYVKSVTTENRVKITTPISVFDFELMIGDSDKKIQLEGDKIVTENIQSSQKLTATFKLKSHSGGVNLRLLQQVFVRVSSTSDDAEAIFVAQASPNQYQVTIDFGTVKSVFGYQSGEYIVELIVGDIFTSNQIRRVFATLHIAFPSAPQSFIESREKSLDGIKPYPEIHHIFRPADRRASPVIALLFTGVVLSPIALLVIGLYKSGANISAFPKGLGSISAVGFQLCLLTILGLYSAYWIGMSLFTTLKYLAVIGLVTIVVGQRHLSSLASSPK